MRALLETYNRGRTPALGATLPGDAVLAPQRKQRHVGTELTGDEHQQYD